MPRLPRSLQKLSPFVALALLVACGGQPQARNVTGPDGSPMLHVTCGRDQGACFELAGRGCPNGYKVFPIFDPRDNNFLIRCQGGDIAALPAPPAANFGAAAFTPAPAPRGAWPENVSIASTPPPTSGTRNDSEIDLGY